MRWIGLFFALSAGCTKAGEGDSCSADSQCGDFVCARDGTCQPASNVRQVKATWTIRGMPASATTCTTPDLYIQFDSTQVNDTLGFEPVPCVQGQFNIDKLPLRFIQVELGKVDAPADDVATIDADGLAMLDLFL